MVTYNHLAEKLTKSNFSEIVEVANTWPEAGEFLSDLLKLAWYNTRIEIALKERPILAIFSSGTHQLIVKRFKELDPQLT